MVLIIFYFKDFWRILEILYICIKKNLFSNNVCVYMCVLLAHQEAQRAQFYVEKAKQDQRHKIIQAEGEAEAAKMVTGQLMCFSLLQWKQQCST